jgi:hypothetical protein
MWDLWWTKWHWGRSFSEYFGFPCHFNFIDCSTFIIIIIIIIIITYLPALVQ